MDAELSRALRAIAMRMGNYRFAQGQARERGENDKADNYADEADKAWRELCRATEPARGVGAYAIPQDVKDRMVRLIMGHTEAKPNPCKLTECQGQPRCEKCVAMGLNASGVNPSDGGGE